MSIEIDELTVNCRVPAELAGGDPRARVFLDRLLEAVRGGLAQALASGFGDFDSDERIAFIESLHFQLTVNLDRPPEEIARRLAGQLSRCLWSRLSDPSTITFRDKTELWARFILDLATGCAYTRTWHDVFAGFRPLSTAAIARSLVEAEPRTAVAALCRLMPSDLKRVISHFSVSDARRAVEAATAAAVNTCRDVRRIADVLAELEEWRSEDPKAHLALVVAIERETGAHVGDVTLHLAEMLMDLARSAGSAGSPADGMGSGADDGFPGVRRSTHATAHWRSYLRKNRSSVGEALSKLRPESKAERGLCFEMGQGGFWLILAHVLENQSRVRNGGVPGRSVQSLAVAFASAAVSCGQHARTVWENRALRSLLQLAQDDDELLSGISDSLSTSDAGPTDEPAAVRPRTPGIESVTVSQRARETSRAFSVRRADARDLRDAAAEIGLPVLSAKALVRMSYHALRAYARRLPGFGPSSNNHLRKNFLLTPATVWCDDAVRVTLAAPALDVIWRVSGAGKAAYTLPDGQFVRVDVRR